MLMLFREYYLYIYIIKFNCSFGSIPTKKSQILRMHVHVTRQDHVSPLSQNAHLSLTLVFFLWNLSSLNVGGSLTNVIKTWFKHVPEFLAPLRIKQLGKLLTAASRYKFILARSSENERLINLYSLNITLGFVLFPI